MKHREMRALISVSVPVKHVEAVHEEAARRDVTAATVLREIFAAYYNSLVDNKRLGNGTEDSASLSN